MLSGTGAPELAVPGSRSVLGARIRGLTIPNRVDAVS